MRQFQTLFRMAVTVTAVLGVSQTIAAQQPLMAVAEKQLLEILALLPGTYTNGEAVYFDGLIEGRPEAEKAAHRALIIGQDEGGSGQLRFAWDGDNTPKTSFLALEPLETGHVKGTLTAMDGDGSCSFVASKIASGFKLVGDCGLSSLSEDGMSYRQAGRDIMLMKARQFKCWISIPKAEGKGWTFHPNLRIHDQGGMAWVEDETAATPKVGFRMRRVHWPYGRNAPSLVLYVHTKDPKSADSYAWADVDATRVGINLRWVQGSCSLPDS